MKTAHFIYGLLIVTGYLTSLNADWTSALEAKREVMGEEVYALLSAQYEAYRNGTSPKIADPRIKSIEIKECHEPLADIIEEPSYPRLTMLPSPAIPFQSPNHNSGYPTALKVRESILKKLWDMLSHMDYLSSDFGYSWEEVDIKVFEGLRDIKTQETIFNNKMHELRNAHPEMTEEQLFKETCTWVSPVKNNVPVHSTGAAVDMRLWKYDKKEFIDMGPFGVIWGANPTAPTFSDQLTDEQINNRLFLLVAAAKAGLINYSYEWWHFSAGDRYASYWLDKEEQRKAIYGAIQ